MADSTSSPGTYKSFNDKLATYMTGNGWIFIPVVFAIAGMVAAAAAPPLAPAFAGAAQAHTVTNGAVLTSFWSPFFSTPATGATGLSAGLSNIWNGAAALFGSGFDVLSAPFSSDMGAIDAMQAAWNEPI